MRSPCTTAARTDPDQPLARSAANEDRASSRSASLSASNASGPWSLSVRSTIRARTPRTRVAWARLARTSGNTRTSHRRRSRSRPARSPGHLPRAARRASDSTTNASPRSRSAHATNSSVSFESSGPRTATSSSRPLSLNSQRYSEPPASERQPRQAWCTRSRGCLGLGCRAK